MILFYNSHKAIKCLQIAQIKKEEGAEAQSARDESIAHVNLV